MKLPAIRIAAPSDHASEIALFMMIAVGVIFLLWRAVEQDKLSGLDVAAFLLVLQGIVSAVKERWTQRSVDRMGQSLANSPPADPPAPAPEER